MIPDGKHYNLVNFPTQYEDLYTDDYGSTIYESMRGRDSLHLYKIHILHNPLKKVGWATLHYQTVGNGFQEFHKFRVNDVLNELGGALTVEAGSNIFDRVFSFYLKLK